MVQCKQPEVRYKRCESFGVFVLILLLAVYAFVRCTSRVKKKRKKKKETYFLSFFFVHHSEMGKPLFVFPTMKHICR